MVKEKRGRVDGSGIELAYGFWPGKGQPVVAIHGLTAHHLFFGGVAERLAGRRPLFAPDLRGRGDSDKPPHASGIDQHAKDIAAAMRAQGLTGKTLVMGHSLGANIATSLAANYPELVAGLILVDGGYTAEFGIGVTADTLKDYLLKPILDRLARTYESDEAHRETWRRDGHFAGDDWTPWVEAYIDYGVGGAPPTLRQKATADAAAEDFGELLLRDTINARLRRVKCPTLLLRATSGFLKLNPPGIADAAVGQFKQFLPQLEDRVVPGSTHYTILLSDPGATIAADAIVEMAEKLGV